MVHMRSVMRCLGIYKKGVCVCVVSTKEKFSFKKSTPHSLLGVVGATFIYVDHNLWLFALLVFSCLVWRERKFEEKKNMYLYSRQKDQYGIFHSEL